MNESVESIVSAFTCLLREKPYCKITVKDICSRSFVHRNTFYYHFQDISELLQYTIRCQEQIILENYTSMESPLDFLRSITEYALHRKDLLSNLYHSQGKEYIYRAIHSLTYNLVKRYVNHVWSHNGELEQADQDVVIRCFASAGSGLLTDWLADDFSYDLMADVQSVYELFEKRMGHPICQIVLGDDKK